MTTQDIFGSRFADACLSKVDFPGDVNNRILEWIKKDSDMLFFIGNPGLGKTYVCAAVFNFWNSQKKNVRCMREKDLFSKLRQAIDNGFDYGYENRRLAEADYVILDDLGSGTMTDWQKEVLFDFVDCRYNSRMPTIITTNLFREDLAREFDKRFLSRLYNKQNAIIELNWIDRRQEGK